MRLWDDMRADMARHDSPALRWLAVLIGLMSAFLATLFDAVFLRFGDDPGVRSAVVFLVSWAVGSFMFYAWLIDLKVRPERTRNRDYGSRSLTDKRTIGMLVGLAVLGILYLLFGDVPLFGLG